MFNPLKYLGNRKVGLALGSGGAKGIAHIAVIEYLQGLGIPIDMIAGSSIGAVVGGLYATGSMEEFKKDLLDMTRRQVRAIFDPVLPRSGLLEGKRFISFLSRYIPKDVRIEELPLPLAVVATEYYTGRSVVFRSGNLLDAIRASVSIPGIMVPVHFQGTFLLDGGVSNPLPLNVIKEMGAGKTIAVNLQHGVNKQSLKQSFRSKQQDGQVMDSRNIVHDPDVRPMPRKVSEEVPGWLGTIEQWIGGGGGSRPSAPSIFEVIFQSIDILAYTNAQLSLKFNKPSVLLEPELLDIGTMEFSEAPRIFTEGYQACARTRKSLVSRVKNWV